MAFLSPPKSVYSSFYEQEKFKLAWNICKWVVVVFSLLTIVYLFREDERLLPSFGAAFIGLVVLIILAVRRSYKIAAYFAFFAASLICQIDIFTLSNLQKVVDICWIITAGIFIFYLLGTPFGYAFYIINLIGLFVAMVLVGKGILLSTVRIDFLPEMIDVFVNVTISIFLSAYMINKITRSSKIAELSYQSANEMLKNQNILVQAQNAEKTVMLKEIHHRVKNNLQVITSLLRLQSKEITDADSVNHFREAVNRVMAMALIHDRLYRSEDLAKIDISGYLTNLADDLTASYSIEIPVKVEVFSEIDHIIPKSLVSVALLYNELISNSLKHGFSQNDEGLIRIELKQSGPGDVEMWYSDNGLWKNPTRENSFGLELIETLTAQLDGTYTLSTTNGTRYHFRFKLEGQQFE